MKQIPSRASYLLEAKRFRPPFLVELPLFEVEHSLVYVDNAQLHLLLERNKLPLAWRFHPSKRVINTRLGSVPPWSDRRLWKGWQNSAWQLAPPRGEPTGWVGLTRLVMRSRGRVSKEQLHVEPRSGGDDMESESRQGHNILGRYEICGWVNKIPQAWMSEKPVGQLLNRGTTDIWDWVHLCCLGTVVWGTVGWLASSLASTH